MSIFDEPKIDCHVHIFDPVNFPYRPDTHYRPAGQETGSYEQMMAVFDAYGTRHALLVAPNSGYGTDNTCLLSALSRSEGRLKGIALVDPDLGIEELAALRAQGVVGVAWNVTFYGVDHYANARSHLARLRELDMCVSLQTEHELPAMLPMLLESGVRILVDHCGRPKVAQGLDQPAFRAVLSLAATGRAWVKLSGMAKYTSQPFPFPEVRPYADALLAAFTPARCLWASDWPYIRAGSRVDYGVLLKYLELLVPDAQARRQVLWDTPRALLGFA